MSRNTVLGHNQAQALLGQWHQIVGAGGWQNSGQPTNLYHGAYGGHRAYGLQPNMRSWGYPPSGMALMGAEMAPPMAYPPPPLAYMPPAPPQYGWPISPRNAMIDYAGPSRADRVILPMSSGVNILPNTSAQVTSRPQNVAFRPERMIIGGTPGDWIVNDIKVGNSSQLSQSGDLPGEMFAATTIDSFVSFQTVQTAMDFVILVTFVGASESGAPFICGVLGTAAI
jgi:hypothetical protein